MKLRPYQQKISEDIDAAWADGAQNVCATLPTGSGKTVVFSNKLLHHTGVSFTVAHRQELVSQMSFTLAKYGVVHSLQASDSLCKYIITEQIRRFGRRYEDPRANCIVAGVKTLLNRQKVLKPMIDRASLWVTDECFPAGTPVDGRPIEQIRVGDKVTAYNERTGGFELRPMLRVFKNPMPDVMAHIGFKGMESAKVTLNHPYFTQRGWAKAGALSRKDVVLTKTGAWVPVLNSMLYATSPNRFVYNLEVEELHTYTANGIVVHNCHHVAGGNEWMQAIGLFPESCRGLGVTATPERADGQGIGRSAAGVFDTLVSGPGMRELINAGYLTDYRIFGPYSNVDLTGVTVGRSGDYSKPKLTAAVRRSPIVGDVVKSYLKFAPGKIGVTFVPDVQTAKDMAASFCGAGVPARVVHAGTPDRERYKSIEMLARGDLKELVNVDVFGEGFDLPAIEVCSFARPTASYPLFVQQFGRSLRLLDGKQHAIIIDHVGNIKRHGLPDRYREWSLEGTRGSKKRDDDLIPIRTCRECLAVYEAYERDCPYCGWQYVTQGNVSIEMVEGDLSEIDPAVLAAMRGEVARVDAPDYEVGEKLRHAGAPPQAVLGAMKNHRLRQEAQTELREMIATWCGYQRAAGQSDSVIMMRFYRTFGLDMVSAQCLGRTEAAGLCERIWEGVR